MPKVEIDPKDIKIPNNVLKSKLGFGRAEEIPEEFRKMVKRAYEELHDVAKPVVLWRDFEVDGSLSFDNMELTGELATKHLSGSKIITVFLATLGKRWTKR